MDIRLLAVASLLVIVALTPTTAQCAQLCESNSECTGPDECIGGACVPPVPDPDAYVAEAMTRWSSYVWAVQFPALFEPTAEECCFDYDGDPNGDPDDGFGAVLNTLAGFPGSEDPVALVDSALASGEMVTILDWRELASDLVSGDVQMSAFDGQWTDATIHADRTLGAGHVAFHRSSFGPFGALDQFNDGVVSAGFIDLTGNQLTLLLPPILFGSSIGLAPMTLQRPRLEIPVAFGEPPLDDCLGLCTIDEDRGAGHTPQIVGGAKLGGLITADDMLSSIDTNYRQCSCAGLDPSLPVLNWYENIDIGLMVVECTPNTGDPSMCDPDDPCADLDTVCGFIATLGQLFDIDTSGSGVNDALSVGLRLGIAGTTLDPMPELFADGFETGDTRVWANGSVAPIAFVTTRPFYGDFGISSVDRVFCDSGACPWSPPDDNHDGIDLIPVDGEEYFRSGCDGMVTSVDLVLNPDNGFYQVNVVINCTADPTGGLLYAFETMSSDINVGNAQLNLITVNQGFPVFAGDEIGAVAVVGPESHLHWATVSESNPVCPEPHLDPTVASEMLALIQRDHPTWEMCH